MSETLSMTNGTSSGAKDAKEKKQKPKRHLPPLPSPMKGDELKTVNYNCTVDISGTSWEELQNYTVFSSSNDGSFPKIKVSKNKFIDIRSGKAYFAGSGRCYKVIF